MHPIYARLLCAELLRRGHAQTAVVQATGIGWAELHAGQEFLSYAQLHRLVTRAASLEPSPTLGLDVGLTTELSAHGAVGYAGMTAAGMSQVLQLLGRYAALRQRLVGFALELADSGAALRLDERLPDGSIREYVLGHVTGALLRLMQSITGRDWTATIPIQWPLPRPAHAGQVLRRLARLQFGAPQWRIELPAALLACPTLAPDPQAHRLAVRDCEQQLAQTRHASVAGRVRAHLLGCDGHFPNLEQFADREHVSTRTLIRRLRAEGTTYQTLLDGARADLACWLLVHGGGSVESIAERLGYADPSNFSRSFRRWCGVTPKAFRADRG